MGLLRAFDGASIPKWSLGITLGALASLFASIRGYILTIPLTSALGQWKWLRCRIARPVSDIASIKRASHGLLESLLLLAKCRGG